ncbi:MAG: hypothetical protein WC988_03980 [Patescibacteria group bacterium]
MSQSIDGFLKDTGKSTTAEYISRIRDGIHKGNASKDGVIANHINLCNYCRPEKSNDA